MSERSAACVDPVRCHLLRSTSCIQELLSTQLPRAEAGGAVVHDVRRRLRAGPGLPKAQGGQRRVLSWWSNTVPVLRPTSLEPCARRSTWLEGRATTDVLGMETRTYRKLSGGRPGGRSPPRDGASGRRYRSTGSQSVTPTSGRDLLSSLCSSSLPAAARSRRRRRRRLAPTPHLAKGGPRRQARRPSRRRRPRTKHRLTTVQGRSALKATRPRA